MFGQDLHGTCPACGHRNFNLFGRRNCRKCGYEFVLEPLEISVFDKFFVSHIDKASKQNTRYFSADELFSIHMRAIKKRKIFLAYLLLIPLIYQALITFGYWGLLSIPILLLVIPSAILFFHDFFVLKQLLQEEFNIAITKYVTAHPQPLLVDRPRLEAMQSEIVQPADDEIERILFVDNPIMVDLLVLNGWHAEQRTLVMSQTAYPAYAQEQCRRLLTEHDQMPVFMLHGATIDANTMSNQIRESGMVTEQHPVIDLGVSAEGLLKYRKLKKSYIGKEGGLVPITMLGYSLVSSALTVAMDQGAPITDFLDVDSEFSAK